MTTPDSPSNLPKFIAPGVYIEEIRPKARSIAGVSTSTTAFVGPATRGPAGTASGLITAYREFEELYGDGPQIEFGGQDPVLARNYLAPAVEAFFQNGGTRLYISRVAAADGTNSAPPVYDDYVRALSALDALDDVSIVAAPGGSVVTETGTASVAPIHAALIAHASRETAYRFAVLDPPEGCSLTDVQAVRAQLDSLRPSIKNAALYYPWIRVPNSTSDPKTTTLVNVPPSGAICGIYARTDTNRGVFKAPANEEIIGATGPEREIVNREQEILNPLGINCLRNFTGRGLRVWGARTVSSDPEWKYVNVRRYFLYLEHSIDQGTKWVVFEPNNEQLWAMVKRAVSDFLLNEWKSGALLGSKPDEAYFVKCDRTTMTQNDLDNGRLVCLVGVAPLKPAEFVIFRISQITTRTV